jgi:hypothetical protein
MDDMSVSGARTFTRIHPLPVWLTSRSSLTFSVPALANLIVCSGQVPPSKLSQVYFTSAGPLVVMVPLKVTLTGHEPRGTIAANVARVARPAATGLGARGWGFAVGCCAEQNPASRRIENGISNLENFDILKYSSL